MDPNTELLLMLQKTARVRNWEDEESVSNDLETLRAEFHKRLYGSGQEATGEEKENGAPGKKE